MKHFLKITFSFYSSILLYLIVEKVYTVVIYVGISARKGVILKHSLNKIL